MSSIPPAVELTTRQRIATALDAAMRAQATADKAARELADLHTIVGAAALASREARENSAKAFKKLADSHKEIMSALSKVLDHIDAGNRP